MRSRSRAASHSSRVPIVCAVTFALMSGCLLFDRVGGDGELSRCSRCEVLAADEEEGDWDRCDAEQAADPERPLEAAGKCALSGRAGVDECLEVRGGDR